MLRQVNDDPSGTPYGTRRRVALYYAVFSAGIRTQQSIDAMAVMYTLSMLVLLLIALRFVDPTQLVTRVRDEQAHN
jgi:putative spermidine/putrescine transport system permease protein